MDEETAITTKIAQLESELAAIRQQLAEVTSESDAARLVKRRRDVEDDLSIRRQALAQLRATNEARAKAAAEKAEQERRQALATEAASRSKALEEKHQAMLDAAKAAVAAIRAYLDQAREYDGWAAGHRNDGIAPSGVYLANLNGMLGPTGVVITPNLGRELAREYQ